MVFTPKAEGLGLQVKLQLRSESSLGVGSVSTAVDMRLQKAQEQGQPKPAEPLLFLETSLDVTGLVPVLPMHRDCGPWLGEGKSHGDIEIPLSIAQITSPSFCCKAQSQKQHLRARRAASSVSAVASLRALG